MSEDPTPGEGPTPGAPRATRRRAAALLAGLGTAALLGALAWRRLGDPQAPSDELCIVAPPLPYLPESGLPPTAARPVPADARCPVCGMYPARHPRWAAQAIYADHAVHFFDSPLMFYLYLHDTAPRNPGRGPADIVAAYVTDFDHGAWIEAGSAWHVAGSGAGGLMRSGDLPAFASREAAQRFAAARGGRVLPSSAIDAALVRALDRRSGHGH